MENQYPPNNQQPGDQYPPNNQPPNYQPPGYQPLNNQPPNYQQQAPYVPQNTTGKGMAIAALVLGIAAMVLPVPVLDLAVGVTGIVLAILAKKNGFTGGLRTAGFVLSIIGSIAAFFYTVDWVTGGAIYGNMFNTLIF